MPGSPTPPELVLGAMYLGTRQDDPQSFALLDAFVESGGTWIDTADAYAFWVDPSGVGGQSEAVIGRWLRSRPDVRDVVRISTKVGVQPTPTGPEGLSAVAVRAGFAGSLKRLGVDQVDLLWAHVEDRSSPIEEQVATFGALVAEGLARRVGASNHSSWRLERALAIARATGVEPYSAVQLRRSYVAPRPGASLPDQGHMVASSEQLDQAAVEGLAVWAYTPLLNGGYVRADRPLPEAYDHPGTTRRLAALDEVAAANGATRNQTVLAWLMGSAPAISPVVGVSSTAQLAEAMVARDLVLTAEQLARLDAAA